MRRSFPPLQNTATPFFSRLGLPLRSGATVSADFHEGKRACGENIRAFDCRTSPPSTVAVLMADYRCRVTPGGISLGAASRLSVQRDWTPAISCRRVRFTICVAVLLTSCMGDYPKYRSQCPPRGFVERVVLAVPGAKGHFSRVKPTSTATSTRYRILEWLSTVLCNASRQLATRLNLRSRDRRHVVITGASAGLGRALALVYARPGVVLALSGRDDARLESCAHACRARGAEVHTANLDVRDAEAMQHWLETFDDSHPIDLLIANAGAASTLAHASDWESRERTAVVVDTNFYGAIHAALPVIERMRVRRCGHIVLISSIAALRGMAISPAYCASKSALKAWGDSVRPILARDGIRMSIVLPGFVKTAMSDVFPGDKPFLWSAERAARYIQRKLEAKCVEIAFPGLLVLGMRLLPLLPATLADAILGRLSYLPREDR